MARLVAGSHGGHAAPLEQFRRGSRFDSSCRPRLPLTRVPPETPPMSYDPPTPPRHQRRQGLRRARRRAGAPRCTSARCATRPADLGAVQPTIEVTADGAAHACAMLDVSQSGVAFAWPGAPPTQQGAVLALSVRSIATGLPRRGAGDVRPAPASRAPWWSVSFESLLDIRASSHLRDVRSWEAEAPTPSPSPAGRGTSPARRLPDPPSATCTSSSTTPPTTCRVGRSSPGRSCGGAGPGAACAHPRSAAPSSPTSSASRRASTAPSAPRPGGLARDLSNASASGTSTPSPSRPPLPHRSDDPSGARATSRSCASSAGTFRGSTLFAKSRPTSRPARQTPPSSAPTGTCSRPHRGDHRHSKPGSHVCIASPSPRGLPGSSSSLLRESGTSPGSTSCSTTGPERLCPSPSSRSSRLVDARWSRRASSLPTRSAPPARPGPLQDHAPSTRGDRGL